MSVVRTNPLPLGAYWIDVFFPAHGASRVVDGRPLFQAFLRNSPDVQLLRTDRDFTVSRLLPGGESMRDWHSFEVLGRRVADFPFQKLGFPTVIKLASAPGGVTDRDRRTTTDDTVQRPPPASFGAIMSEKLSTFDLRPLVVGGLVVWLLSHLKGQR